MNRSDRKLNERSDGKLDGGLNSRLDGRFKLDCRPLANKGAVVQGGTYRFTVLTSRMIRLEYDESGRFEDRATQIVLNRDFPVPEYRVAEKEDSIEIITEHIHLIYNKKKFSKNGLNIEVKGNLSYCGSVWHFGEAFDNLKGTARTLDEADGPIPLEGGLLSRNGFSVIDDGRSFLIEDDGWVTPRDRECVDIYFLGYGRQYLACLRDFFRLSGRTPMLPRYALGNWWSRFHPYSETEYKELIENFKKEEVPLSVAVLDMDWHLTDIDPKYGSGWTGYTWNRNLFPDPEAFMGWLHKEGLHVTLNVHPADGVKAYEEMYADMAKALGADYQNGDKINFDITDPKFLEAYFKYIHHPNEERGVDFWWIDWQQGRDTKLEGLDPLWMLNHYHFLDNGRNGKRALILSRYAGIGSHRYPVGFSGDTFATWESLDFQPYFTATASNAGYGWWSHDIGGHMHGVKSDEMAARWVQFGVFSPIMRIHSSNNPFMVKKPWLYNEMVEKTIKRFMRLRHQLVPYLYTMNRRFHMEGEPLVQPMYYRHAEEGEAYEVPNQYYFGTDLIVCPITKPMDKSLDLGCFKAWLPEGVYFDFFTGRVYRGGRRICLYRDIYTIPVLAKAGSIIPMVSEASVANGTDNPEEMEIRIFAGDNGSFSLYEDNSQDNSVHNLREAVTAMEFSWGDTSEFTIKGYVGQSGVVPAKRSYILKFAGFVDPGDDTGGVEVRLNGRRVPFEKRYYEEPHAIELKIRDVDTAGDMTVRIKTGGKIAENDIQKQIFHLLNKAQIEFDLKSAVFREIKRYPEKSRLLGVLQAMDLENNLLGALFEIITA